MHAIIHRGSHQIGGSCLELANGESRVVFDVGLPLEVGSHSPSPPTPDLDVPGLFKGFPRVDAVFLSHAHPDHSGLLSRVHSDVPVYVSKGTGRIMTVAARFSRGSRLPRQTKVFKSSEPTRVHALQVTPVPVDHSAFDAHAFLVEAEGRRVLYTGDWRAHGRKPGMLAQLIRRARAEGGIDLLVTEGTRFSRGGDRGLSETDVEARMVDLIREKPRLALVACSPQNVDRLVTLVRVAIRTGRTLVVDFYAAMVLRFASRVAKGIPDPLELGNLRVAEWTTWPDPRSPRDKRWSVHAFRLRQRQCPLAEVLDQPGQFICLFRPSMNRLASVLPEGSLCLYSMWQGYLDTQEWRHMQAMLTVRNIALETVHASGHISLPDLEDAVRAIAPRKLMFMHTNEPQGVRGHFQNLGFEVVNQRDGEEIRV